MQLLFYLHVCKMHVRWKYEDDQVISTCESLERMILCDAVKLAIIIVMQKQLCYMSRLDRRIRNALAVNNKNKATLV